MLRRNNHDIDFAALEERVVQVQARRRERPWIAPYQGDHAAEQEPSPAGTAPEGVVPAWRARLRRVPVLGPALANVRRRLAATMDTGLTWKERLRHFPVLGPAVFWVNGLLRAPQFRERASLELDALQAYLHTHVESQLADLLRQSNHLRAQVELQVERLDLRVDHEHAANVASNRRHDERDERIAALQDRLGASQGRLDTLQDRLGASQDHLGTLQDRLGALAQAVRRLEGMDAPKVTAARESAAPPLALSSVSEDQFYLDLEDRFRGRTDAIRARLQVHAPLIARAGGGAPGAGRRVLDLGCGRGEWLDLLREWGHTAEGVDLSHAMAAVCAERGHAVHSGDALAFLRAQPSASVDAVTAFHLIEHLQLPVLLALVDETLRVLRAGGLAVFETPNPENMQVGACSFYLDPTHLHPIPPMLAEFVALQRGFARAEILRLSAYPASHLVPEDNELSRRFNQLMYGPQDYALVAWKHGE